MIPGPKIKLEEGIAYVWSFIKEGVCWYQWEGSRKTKLVGTSKNVGSTSSVNMEEWGEHAG